MIHHRFGPLRARLKFMKEIISPGPSPVREMHLKMVINCNQRPLYNLSKPFGQRDKRFKSWYQEVSKLKAKFESLQRSQRHLLGEDLGSLNVKELQQLERQLESALSQARKRKAWIT